jgi:hypothetical protein
MKSAIFWDETPCGLAEVHRRFGGTHLCENGVPDDCVNHCFTF